MPVSGNTEHTRPENRAFYPALDGLRALAFLMVFFWHYAALPWGLSGVDLFFVLSGFLITGILFDTRDAPHRVRNFYLRRTLRIFPLYYGVLLALLLLYPVFHWQWGLGWLIWPLYLGNYARFAHPYVLGSPLQRLADFQPTGQFGPHPITLYLGHFWSLCVEEQFYLIWPWLVFWIRDRRKLLWICALTLPLCLTARLLGQRVLPEWMVSAEILYRATPFRLDALLLGGVLALILRGPHAHLLLRAARIVTPIVLAALVFCALLLPSTRIWSRSYVYPTWIFTSGLTLVDLLAALLILLALQSGSSVYRLFKLRPLRWLGRISYGAYVLHDIPHPEYTRFALRHFPAHPTRAAALVALPTTILLAWLSFRFLESPFLNLKERWTISRDRSP